MRRALVVAFALAALAPLQACDAVVAEAAPDAQAVAVAAAAPLTGLAAGTDYADHACEIVLREATSGGCVRSHCTVTARFDVAADVLADGATGKLLLTNGDGQWWTVDAQATGATAAPGYARLEAAAVVPSTGRYELVPYYAIDGARVFDHNVVVDDLASYVLDGASGYALTTPADVCPGDGGGSPGAEVRLLHAWKNSCAPVSGCAADEELRGLVEVKNLAYEKRVGVVYDPGTGAWQEAAAAYVGPSRAGFELWSFDVPGGATAFALSYEVAGQTYWDNNGGEDYHLARYGLDALLSPERDLALGWLRDFRAGAGVLQGAVVLRNHSYHKTVTVTVRDVPGVVAVEAAASYYTTLPSGLEVWSFDATVSDDVDAASLRLTVDYAWEGGQATDDDYGRGYRLDEAGALTY